MIKQSTSPRARFTLHNDGDVTLTWRDPMTDEDRTTVYFVPRISPKNAAMHYVRIRDKAGRFPQVCEALSPVGDTLMSSREGLLSAIRREHKRRMGRIRRLMASSY